MFQFTSIVQSKDSLDFYVLGNLISKTSYAFGLTFVFCEIGQRLSDTFDDLADDFYQCEYESLPNNLQRMIPTLLVIMQNTPALQSLGSSPCSRETFKKVIHFYTFQKSERKSIFNQCYELIALTMHTSNTMRTFSTKLKVL